MTIAPISSVLVEARRRAGLTQRQLAERAKTAQSVVANIERGKANPTLETIGRLLDAAGFDLRVELVPRAAKDPVIEGYKKDIDRTLLRENLGRTVDGRLRTNAEAQLFVNELRRAKRVAERPP
jgi:transcriptional regulator with XRE-family HTH domain